MRFLLSALLLLTTNLFPQTFVAESPISEVSKSDFYRVLLDPLLMKYVKNDLSNLRILDSTEQEIPYILSIESPRFSTPLFREYKILLKERKQNCCTRLIVENESRKPINNVSVVIKNADVYKQASLLGSDDQQSWYALKENFFLHTINNPAQTYEIRILNFPLSNYKYLTLTINDSLSAPLNILKVGYYEVGNEIQDPEYSSVPGLQFQVSDSSKQKQTHVSIRFDTTRLVDKIELTIAGLPFYHRQATLYSHDMVKDKRGKMNWADSFVQNIVLTSTHSPTIMLGGEKYKMLVLIINNNDNPPLPINSVDAYQLNRYAIAWLKKGMTYSLKIGDDNMTIPNYDLDYFNDNMPALPMILKIEQINPIKNIEPQKESPGFFKNSQLIWTVIILVAALLIYMSVRMINETKSNTPS